MTNEGKTDLNGALFDPEGWRSETSVTIGEQALTFEQLYEAARAFASLVRGAPPVAVHATPSLETIVGVLGCLIAGVPAVPVPPDVGVSERDHIINDSGAALWLGAATEGLLIMPCSVDLARRTSSS